MYHSMLAMYDSMSKRRGIRWLSCLSHCAASRKVADESTGSKEKDEKYKNYYYYYYFYYDTQHLSFG